MDVRDLAAERTSEQLRTVGEVARNTALTCEIEGFWE
jgi:hypothetical protein